MHTGESYHNHFSLRKYNYVCLAKIINQGERRTESEQWAYARRKCDTGNMNLIHKLQFLSFYVSIIMWAFYNVDYLLLKQNTDYFIWCLAKETAIHPNCEGKMTILALKRSTLSVFKWFLHKEIFRGFLTIYKVCLLCKLLLSMGLVLMISSIFL